MSAIEYIKYNALFPAIIKTDRLDIAKAMSKTIFVFTNSASEKIESFITDTWLITIIISGTVIPNSAA